MFLGIRTEISKDDRALLFHRMIEALRRCGFPSHVSVTKAGCLLVADGGRGAEEIMAALDGMAQHVEIFMPKNPNSRQSSLMPHKARVVSRSKRGISAAESLRAEGRSNWGPLKPYCSNCAHLRLTHRVNGCPRYACHLMTNSWALSTLQTKHMVPRVQACRGDSFEVRRTMEIPEASDG